MAREGDQGFQLPRLGTMTGQHGPVSAPPPAPAALVPPPTEPVPPEPSIVDPHAPRLGQHTPETIAELFPHEIRALFAPALDALERKKVGKSAEGDEEELKRLHAVRCELFIKLSDEQWKAVPDEAVRFIGVSFLEGLNQQQIDKLLPGRIVNLLNIAALPPRHRTRMSYDAVKERIDRQHRFEAAIILALGLCALLILFFLDRMNIINIW